jgi:hypothetical protein
MRPPSRALVLKSAFALLNLAFLATSGCNVIGAAAQLLPRPDIKAAYSGLAYQTVGVMVWADRGIRIDFPTLQADVASSLTKKLQDATNLPHKKEVPKELEGATYLNPMAVIRFQEDHPELEGQPSTDLATRLGVTRVIYLEIYAFETRSDLSIDLYKGTVMARLEVLEVHRDASGKKTATVAYQNPDLKTTFPPNRPEGIGGDNVNPTMMYVKTVDTFTDDVARLFAQHSGE